MENLKTELNKIEQGKSSFLGIDGGKISSKIWFCGIEFGGTLDEMSEYYKNTTKYYDSDKFSLPIPYREASENLKTSKYDLYISEMIINMFKIQNISRSDYFKNKLYNENSDIFKLNLYPLSKVNTGWDKNITKIFKITQNDYYNKYFEFRKVFLKSLITTFKPKKIICTSVKNSELQFVEAFFGNKAQLNYERRYIELMGINDKLKKFKIIEVSSNDLSLIIIPFPGTGNGNLNSYNDVINMANYLRDNYL